MGEQVSEAVGEARGAAAESKRPAASQQRCLTATLEITDAATGVVTKSESLFGGSHKAGSAGGHPFHMLEEMLLGSPPGSS